MQASVRARRAPAHGGAEGTGGTFSMGSGDGAPTQSLGCATFERASRDLLAHI